jgi:hypothetical protein
MNWGTKIAIFYIFFVIVTLGMVFKSTFHRWDLVSQDYYGEELKYQSQIDKINNCKSLSQQPTMSVEGKNVLLQIALQSQANGKILFYKPADEFEDFEVALALNDKGEQVISIPSQHSGRYTAQLNWTTENKAYFKEFYLILP